jgi:hypothetical protein
MGTKDEQQTAKIATRSLNFDLKISFTAKINPALEFKSRGFRRPVLFEDCFP